MITSLAIVDSDGNDVTLDARRASGLVGVGALRDSRRVRPTAHGGIDETRWEDGRLMVFELQARGDTAADAFSDFRRQVSPMMETLDVGPAVLKWTEKGDTGLALQRTVRLAAEVDPPVEPAPNHLVFQAQFYAEDPRAYSQTLTTKQGDALSAASGGLTIPVTFPFTFTPSGGGTVSVTNSGNRPSPPVFRIYGFCESPQIVLVGKDKRIALTSSAEIGAGDYWEIDVAKRTVKTQGGVTQMQHLDPASTTWFELPPGDSSLQLIAADFDDSARLDVLLRSAYT